MVPLKEQRSKGQRFRSGPVDGFPVLQILKMRPALAPKDRFGSW